MNKVLLKKKLNNYLFLYLAFVLLFSCKDESYFIAGIKKPISSTKKIFLYKIESKNSTNNRYKNIKQSQNDINTKKKKKLKNQSSKYYCSLCKSIFNKSIYNKNKFDNHKKIVSGSKKKNSKKSAINQTKENKNKGKFYCTKNLKLSLVNLSATIFLLIGFMAFNFIFHALSGIILYMLGFIGLSVLASIKVRDMYKEQKQEMNQKQDNMGQSNNNKKNSFY